MRLMKKMAVVGAAALALTGCIHVPAAHAPTTTPEPTVEDVMTDDQMFLTAVRNAAPDAGRIEDHVLIEAAHVSCDLAREYGFDGGIDVLAMLAVSEGWGEDELIVLGAVYGGGIAVYCPEVS